MRFPNFISKIKIIVFILAGLWAIVACLYLIFTPTTVQIQEAVNSSPVDGSHSTEIEIKEISWYEAQGAWGITAVIIFGLIYVMTSASALLNYRTVLVIFSILAATLTFLAGFSIGGLYVPALGEVVLGWILLGVEQFLNKRGQPQQ